MDQIEFEALAEVMLKLIDHYGAPSRFLAADICKMHELWLGKIYRWAGHYRNVNLQKDGFPFAAAQFIPKLMNDFENHELKRSTPCHFESVDEIAYAIAVTHTELVLIHPFIEGNGRIFRALSS